MKKCTKCGVIKDNTSFSVNTKLKDGIMHMCKECDKKRSREYKQSKHGLVNVMYSSQKRCANKRGHLPPSYTKEEFKIWLYSQDAFHNIYANWVNSGFDKKKTPSVDRIKNDESYTMDNIQIVTWHENDTNGKKSSSIAVSQYSTNNEFIASFVSGKDAERKTGVTQSNISACCRGKNKTAGGFIWRHQYN